MASPPTPGRRECTSPACRFRYPVADPAGDRLLCPLCGAPTHIHWAALPPAQMNAPAPRSGPGHPLEVLLDNVRSAYNVGSILRTADGVGALHVHLAGITPQPDNPKVVKTALGAQQSMAWTYHRNGVDAVHALRGQGKQIWALDIFAASDLLLPQVIHRLLPFRRDGEPAPVVLVVGNEARGIDPGIVDLADRLVTIPMRGSKRTLNVAVAFGIAAFAIVNGKPLGHS